ncbi:MAG: hypothetical protein QOJ35_3212 [Solirubrobacteraceae bacterium]|jgi:hypothetical protein|nr:hypothetical protein [Solirubrobacteraceae bacterium]
MLTISITFAVLVALWGFSGTIASLARRGLTRTTPRPARSTPRPARSPVSSRPRAGGPMTTA